MNCGCQIIDRITFNMMLVAVGLVLGGICVNYFWLYIIHAFYR